jgi:16S rRNA (cytosine1402-N4)-methyltransferase
VEIFHTPVLLEETLHYLAPRREGELMIDATLGEGGHSAAFLERFPGLCIVGLDADGEIQCRARERLASFGSRISFFTQWAGDFFTGYPSDIPSPDTIFFDLGISLYHYEGSRRGFSFLRNEYLDMRLDTSRGKTAADLIAELPERDFADLLYNNAGERYSRRIAAAVQTAKINSPLTTTAALAELVAASVPAVYRNGPIHPATRTFQALRMAVNEEEQKLPLMLEAALEKLKSGGRMGVISFHSGEDRAVKNFFRKKSKDCTCPPEAPICRCEGVSVTILTRKPVTAGKDECRDNPPSRSAKFRAAEKISASGAVL